LNAAATSGLPITFSLVSGPATVNGTSLTITGAGTVAIAANQAGNVNYLSAPQVAENIVVGKAPVVAAVATSVNATLVQNSITFTATSTSSAGTPTGTVTFMDGATPLGTATLASGVATLTISTLVVGAHAVTATYGGDTNFLPTASTPLTQLVQDFTFTLSMPSVTVKPGNTAVLNFTVDPMNGTTFPSAINLTLSGLPAGATYSSSPATITAGAGATTVTLTIDIPQAQASAQPLTLHPGTQLTANHRGGPNGGKTGSLAGSLAPFSMAFVMLPFAGRLRRAGKQLGRIMCVLLLLTVGMAAAAGISACSGGGCASGSFAQPQQTYAVAVTGASGALSHTATVTLTVE
jgi:Bacterial Ig-like domain (group 3)